MPTRVASALLDSYSHILGTEVISRIQATARATRGARILHVSAPVPAIEHARLLVAAIRLMAELGVDVDWVEVPAERSGAALAQSLVDAIEGEIEAETTAISGDWQRYGQRWAHVVQRPYDFIVVHDPQLLAIRPKVAPKHARARWIWHCYLDLRDCTPAVRELLADYMARFDVVAMEHLDFSGDLPLPGAVVIPPAIDPFSERNVTLHPREVDEIFRRLELPRAAPLVVQVSRFDGWDDPRWALFTFEAARKTVPNLQLALVSTSLVGDASLDIFRAKIDRPGMHLLRSTDAAAVEINALQGAALAAVQHGVRKGFSSALLEASWKGRPVLAGVGGALNDQVIDGETGFVFDRFEQGAELICRLAREPTLGDVLGFRGHRVVRDNHLVIRWVEEYLNVMAGAVSATG